MAAPNINSFNTLTFKAAVGALTTSLATLVANAGGSNKMIEIVSIFLSNIDGTNSCHSTVTLQRGGTDYRLVYQVVVPAGAVLVPVLKDSPVHLEESDTLRGSAQNNGDLEYVVNYREYTT